MSTRSYIGIEENGLIDYVYCHMDGYPAYNGKMLINHYNTETTIKQLLGLNYISAICDDVETTKKNNAHLPPTRESTPTEFKDLIKIAEQMFIEYIYIFKNNHWHYYNIREATMFEWLNNEWHRIEVYNF